MDAAKFENLADIKNTLFLHMNIKKRPWLGSFDMTNSNEHHAFRFSAIFLNTIPPSTFSVSTPFSQMDKTG